MIFKKRYKNQKLLKLRPVQILFLGFVAFVLLGTFILMLPIASANKDNTSFIDALFTSTSAVCVTGLTVLDTGTHWSVFGQVVILILIQIGGVGFMTFSTFIAILLGRRIGLRGRLIVKESFNAFDIQGLVKLVIYVVITTFVIEVVGAMILTTQFLKDYDLGTAIYYGIFHSISAFCNSGFVLFNNFSSYIGYYNNPIIIVTIVILIVIGGLGFIVISEIISHKKNRKYSLHSKVVLISTLILIIFSTVFFFSVEYNNMKTIGGFSFLDKFTSSILMAVTPRSAGFTTIPLSDMSMSSHFITIILMFIGGAPGSAAGGIKVTTAVILLMTVISITKGRNDTEIMKKRIGRSSVYKSISIVFISCMLVVIVTIILLITESKEFIVVLYETVSAFGTSGLSLNLTPDLTFVGKLILSITMYIGRIGPLTFMFTFIYKNKVSDSSIKYPEGKIIVG